MAQFPRSPSTRRLLTMSLLVGAAVGAWAGQRTRASVLNRPKPTMIDWDQARRLALSMNREASLAPAQKEHLRQVYSRLVEQAVPLVAAYTGDDLPSALQHVFAFDRADWIEANISSFADMFEPLEALNPLAGDDSPRPIALVWGNVNQRMVSSELGFLLGYLARRVLGQYDLALLGREPVGAGKLYFVQPNIEMVERGLSLPQDDFRLWLALHEVTHAFEFEAHPWLRQHVNGMLDEYFAFLKRDVSQLQRGVDGARDLWSRVRERDGNESWIELVMTPAQRELFNRMQATMSVIEGYSNHVMNTVGRQLLPTYETISRRFERRQQQRTPAEQLFARLTGLDIKMEQYRLGEAFINEVVARRGHDFARLVWSGPEYLPSLSELRTPGAWIARIDTLQANANGMESQPAV